MSRKTIVRHKQTCWHLWYAWYPIRIVVDDSGCETKIVRVWREYVWRRKTYGLLDSRWLYSLNDVNNKPIDVDDPN